MYKVTISVEHKIATAQTSGEMSNNEIAVVYRFEVQQISKRFKRQRGNG